MFRVDIKVEGIVKYTSKWPTVPECTAWVAENYDAFPQGYVAEIVDISAVIRRLGKKKNALLRLDMGVDIISDLIVINEERFELGQLSQEQFVAMLNDPTLYKIERLLWNGSLKLAKSMIEAVPDTYYTALHKEQIITKISTFLLSIGEE